MKLSYKRTILVGMAFFLICTFWQAYDSIIPKILTDKFGLPQVWSGVIMALDNVLAVFLLPIFGAISDKRSTKLGRRTPFILFGTLFASALLIALSIIDNVQLASLTEEGVTAATDGRIALAAAITGENVLTLVLFMVVLALLLISMAIFRSPAVALMPDVTPKPLRSKANAIINLCGTLGGILVLAMGIVFGTGKPDNALMSYTGFFAVVAGIMLVALIIFMFTVKEKRWAAEADEINSTLPDTTKEKTEDAKGGTLSGSARRSLFFILASVALWFMGYNAVISKYSVYAGDVLKLDYNLTLMIAQAAAIVAYIPVGIISQKIGRKKMILAGVVMLGTAFAFASFMREGSSIWIMNILFILAGIGWASINVNSYPMVVELAGSGDVGKYTGYYYTASMLAQIVTPILSGAFLTYVGMNTLFPYAAIFVAAAFVTMLFVTHGDNKTSSDGKKDILEHLDVD